MVKPILRSMPLPARLLLVQSTALAVVAALRHQGCDHDEEYAAVLEQHVARALDTVLSELKLGPGTP